MLKKIKNKNNPPTNLGDMGSIPGLARFPHAAKQLSPHATTTELCALEPVSHNYEAQAHTPRAHPPRQEKPL